MKLIKSILACSILAASLGICAISNAQSSACNSSSAGEYYCAGTTMWRCELSTSGSYGWVAHPNLCAP